MSKPTASQQSLSQRRWMEINNPLLSHFQFLLFRDTRAFFQIAKLAGVSPTVISAWRTLQNSPSLLLFDAVLNVLGYKLAIVPLEEKNAEH